jgi:hypothetical protein
VRGQGRKGQNQDDEQGFHGFAPRVWA